VVWGFSPLDEELELVSGDLAPRMEEALCRLSGWAPFERARELLTFVCGVQVSEATARRHTQRAGTDQLAVQAEEVKRIEGDLPSAPLGPQRAFVSTDGAMAPLVGGQWAEVKTLVIGRVQGEEGGEAHVVDLSSFSRLAEVETFTNEALYEVHRRGIENSQEVGVVADGAEWIQGFADWHCPRALRILDFPHAGEHVSACAHVLYKEGTPQEQQWVRDRLHQLKQEGPADVLLELGRLAEEHPEDPVLAEHLPYLKRRVSQMQYPAFQQAGWPIGSGPMESANKLVVEARLKGAGMHWTRQHVNPMLALRNVLCNDRWDEAWKQIQQRRKHERAARRATRVQQSAAVTFTTPTQSTVVEIPRTAHEPDGPLPERAPASKCKPAVPQDAPRKPAANHPWRRSPIGHARVMEPRTFIYAKN
jgi:hypothetical protein